MAPNTRTSPQLYGKAQLGAPSFFSKNQVKSIYMAKKKVFLVLDGNALLHRAWHAIPPLTTSSGQVVNAVYGFLNIIEKMREQYAPDFMAVAWDLPGATFRHEAYAEYKGTREKKADELYEQIDVIKDALDVYGIPSLSAEGYEADDVIATLAKKYAKDDVSVKILSGDMDLLQLVDGAVRVIAFKKGISETVEYDKKAVQDRYGLDPKQMVDFKALMGDPSDNIPGIEGIGKKTAATLLQEHGSINNLLRALKRDELEEKYAKRLRGKEKELKDMQALVQLIDRVKLPGFKITDAKFTDPDVEVLVPMLEQLEFRNLLRKYKRSEDSAEQAPIVRQKVATIDQLKADDLYVAARNVQADLFGKGSIEIVFSDGTKIAKAQTQDEVKQVIELINKAKLVIGHDLKSIMHLLESSIEGKVFDTMVAAYLVASHERDFDISACAKKYFKKNLKEDAALDSQMEVIIGLYKKLEKLLAKEGSLKLATDVEMPLARNLYIMEREGIEVDADHLKELSDKFEKELKSLTAKIYKFAGEEFNIKSPSQLSHILFDVLKLPTKRIKKTKTGLSTAASELEKLWETHEIIPLVSKYREFAKMKSTYVDALPELIEKDGRIHSSFNQTVTATGRLSSSDPNLQNIPVRTELGREIRNAFTSKHGYTLVACDYSQFELRLAAVMAKDSSFIRAFKEGADIHTRTASEILDKPESEIDKHERHAAKAINFGILYGMGPRNLARSSGLSKEEAQGFIDKYFELHPGIANYIEEMKDKAHKDKYVETLFGRRRYLPEIDSGMQMLRAAAERMAVNMPIQGTQADLVKMAMLKVQTWVESTDLDLKMLLQVHDELVFEVKNSDVEKAVVQIKKIMEGVWDSEVPLIVDVEHGKHWGKLKAWK
jgi:DNA polymerase I